MKKLLLSTILIFLVLFTQAQARVDVGLKGGLNLASIDANDAAATYNSTTGFHAGVYGMVKITKLAIQPEILYSTQGSSFEIASVQDDLSQEMVYLNIPVMVKLYLVAGLNLQVGPQFGLLMSAKQDQYNGTSVSEADIKDQLKNSDISAAFGAGWDAPFGLNFTARYVLGLNDVNDVPGDGAIKNRVFQVSLGYRLFKIGN